MASSSKAETFYRRSKELLDLSTTLSGPQRDQLIRVALIWKRLAEEAEEEGIPHQSPPGTVRDPD